MNIDTGREQRLHQTALPERGPVFGQHPDAADRPGHRARRGHRRLRAGFLDARPADAEPGAPVRLHQGSIPDQTLPAGRFVPERVFTQADYVHPALHRLLAPVRRVLRSVRERQDRGEGQPWAATCSRSRQPGGLYNPRGGGSDTATWTDPNGDDIAQESELGPLANRNFGQPAGVTTPDPDMQRPYQMLYNVAVQQELMPGLSVTLGYYHRRYYDDTVDGQPRDHARGLLDHPDPRPARQRPDDQRLQHRSREVRPGQQLRDELQRELADLQRRRSVVHRAAPQRRAAAGRRQLRQDA